MSSLTITHSTEESFTHNLSSSDSSENELKIIYTRSNEKDGLVISDEINDISSHEVLIEDSYPTSISSSGIEAADISSLFEQFLEYEQGSEPCSYPNSSCLSPAESSAAEESSKDSVLGQLMIVKEVLTQEADKIQETEQADRAVFQPKEDGLLRTVNGIHPKGMIDRMADSPKFAKFKRKKVTKEPPLRRAVSASTTPKSLSPNGKVMCEERKKREAKLIEALALNTPAKTNNAPTNIAQKRKPTPCEPLPSRLQPVVPKRKKKITKATLQPQVSDSLDPRLNKMDYGEAKNVTQLLNTNLIDNSEHNTASETVDDITIVDMTVDHDVLPTKIVSVAPVNNSNPLHTEIEKKDIKIENKDKIADLRQKLTAIANSTVANPATIAAPCQIKTKKRTAKKPPKMYRNAKSNDATEKMLSSDSESEDEHLRNASPRPRLSRSSRVRSRTHSLSRSPTPPRYYSRSRSPSPTYSDKEVEDINEKMLELSEPVPYDIENERRINFLVGKTSKGNFERRNIYAGGISKQTSKEDLAERFKRFGNIEKITLHFRDKGDNYAFVVYEQPEDAIRAIEEGNDDAKYPPLELCFGGRRKFVGGSYVDFDGNNSYLAEKAPGQGNSRCPSPEDDFDKLLKMAMKEKSRAPAIKEEEPEWS